MKLDYYPKVSNPASCGLTRDLETPYRDEWFYQPVTRNRLANVNQEYCLRGIPAAGGAVVGDGAATGAAIVAG